MKPHEEMWRQDIVMNEFVETSDGGARAEAFGDQTGTRDEVARFIAAAPEMARALLHVVSASTGHVLDIGVIEAALRKAGVL